MILTTLCEEMVVPFQYKRTNNMQLGNSADHSFVSVFFKLTMLLN